MSHHKEMREAHKSGTKIQLKEGGYYKNRLGDVIGPIKLSDWNSGYPFFVPDGETYTNEGHMFASGESQEDLVEEIVPPTPKEVASGSGYLNVAWSGYQAESVPCGGGTKHDSGKPRLELIPRSALEAEARVLAHGADKYGKDNWRKGFDFTRLIGAIMRHTQAYNDGEDLDPESGLPHLAHIRATAGFLIEFTEKGLGNDDRVKG